MNYGVTCSVPCAKCGRPFMTVWPPVPGRMCVRCMGAEMNVEDVERERVDESRARARVAKRERLQKTITKSSPDHPRHGCAPMRNYGKRMEFAAAHGGVCCFCGCVVIVTATMCPQMATYEHVIPRTMGGTNRRSNLKLSCYLCNTTRGHMDFDLYIRLPRGPDNRPILPKASPTTLIMR